MCTSETCCNVDTVRHEIDTLFKQQRVCMVTIPTTLSPSIELESVEVEILKPPKETLPT